MTLQEAIALLQDKHLDIKKVKDLYNKFGEEIEGSVAMNLSLRTSVYDREKEKNEIMVELLTRLSKAKDMSARWAVAKNPHTPKEVLKELSNDKINLVRALCATNPNTPKEALEKFMEDEKIVRDGLSGNPSTPIKYLAILAKDSDKMVRLRVAENPSTTEEILKELSKDSDLDVSKAAQIHLEKLKKGKA